jgi:hypothetical protein
MWLLVVAIDRLRVAPSLARSVDEAVECIGRAEPFEDPRWSLIEPA